MDKESTGERITGLAYSEAYRIRMLEIKSR